MNSPTPASSVEHPAHPAADLCVFIGRFQPFHKAHQRVVEEGLRHAGRVLVLVGSANEPRTLRNPFTAQERMAAIQASFSHDPRVLVAPLEDSTYDTSEWVERTYRTVEQAWEGVVGHDPTAPQVPNVALIGHAKDATSYYLNLFPRWGEIRVPKHQEMAATHVRGSLFGSYAGTCELLERFFPQEAVTAHADAGSVTKVLRQILNTTTPAFLAAYTDMVRQQAQAFLALPDTATVLPAAVIGLMNGFLGSEAFETLAHEQAHVFKGKYAWRLAPYPPVFVTADAVVRRDGRVLMVKRANFPGKGLWALPGGFLEQDETLLECALRELDEETLLSTDRSQLKNALVGSEMFDAPFRSSRGRTVTHAHYFDLPSQAAAHTKTGGQTGDTETQAIDWRDPETLRRDEVFEDHYSIIARAQKHFNQV